MKILVLGASRGTGALCVGSALAKGHAVTALSRTPAKLDVTHPALTKVAGDFHDAASVRGAVAGQDAVIICASPGSLGTIKEKPDYFSRGTRYCIDAMKEHFGDRVMPPIRQATRLKEAPAQGKTIFEYAPESNAAEDYLRVVDLLVDGPAGSMKRAVGQ